MAVTMKNAIPVNTTLFPAGRVHYLERHVLAYVASFLHMSSRQQTFPAGISIVLTGI
jgi:hypothetical protein